MGTPARKAEASRSRARPPEIDVAPLAERAEGVDVATGVDKDEITARERGLRRCVPGLDGPEALSPTPKDWVIEHEMVRERTNGAVEALRLGDRREGQVGCST